MIFRKKGRRHSSKLIEDPSDDVVDHIMDELHEEENPLDNLEEKIKEHRNRFWKKMILAVVIVIAVSASAYLLINYQTYNEARVLHTYKKSNSENNNYAEFSEGVLKYSRDGVTYLNKKGEEQWNQPCQIKTPIVGVCGDSAVVADSGGNTILVFRESGIKGEIQTTLPIEKVAVSAQGIVSVMLKDGNTPKIVCYDATGNILVEHKASVAGTGYPIDIAISENGYMLLVSYLYVQDGKVFSKISYFNFERKGQTEEDYKVTSAEYEDQVMPSVFFMNNKVSVIVGDKSIVFYEGEERPEEKDKIMLDKEIKSVFHNEKYVGVILKNEGKEGYELRLYRSNGTQAMKTEFTGEYKTVKIVKNQILMYDGKKCSIFSSLGVKKFEGEMDSDILELFPTEGVNKYLMMTANGLNEIRLVK